MHRFNTFIKTIKCLIIIMVLCCTQTLSGQPDSLFHTANKAYKDGDYSKAINYYQAIIDSGYQSANIYYNLGNAHFKADHLAYAIVNYERANLLAPRDEDIDFNLGLAKQKVTDEIEVMPEIFIKRWFDSLINVFTATTWSAISIIAFIFTLTALLFYLFSHRLSIRKSSFYGSILLIIFTNASFVFANRQHNRLTNNQYAIIKSSAVTAKGAPDNSGTDLFVVHEGVKVKVMKDIENWYEIRLSDGNKGWVQAKDIIKI